jgi:large-conductance mechanosensitive channel
MNNNEQSEALGVLETLVKNNERIIDNNERIIELNKEINELNKELWKELESFKKAQLGLVVVSVVKFLIIAFVLFAKC